MARNRPLTALLMGAGVEPTFWIRRVFSILLPGTEAAGHLGHLFGPQMGLDALTINPWFNMMGTSSAVKTSSWSILRRFSGFRLDTVRA